MVPSLQVLAISRVRRSRWQLELLAVAISTFALVFGAYAFDVFGVSRGVVFIPGDATLVGLAVAVALAAAGRGLLFAWGMLYAALLGAAADHYLLGLSGRPLGERVIALLGLDGLVFFTVATLVLGTLAWSAGWVVLWGVASIRDASMPSESR